MYPAWTNELYLNIAAALKITNIIRNRGVLTAVAERDADDADRTAVEPFSALTAAININFGTVFAIGAAYLIVITQLLDQPPQIMYPPCDNDSCKTTNLVIPAALRLFQGVHDLCRYPTLFV